MLHDIVPQPDSATLAIPPRRHGSRDIPQSIPMARPMSIPWTAVLLAGIAAATGPIAGPARGQSGPPNAAEEIRIEATRADDDPEGLPLPLACSWTCGNYPKESSAGWSPANQLRLIEAGHHLLPWFAQPAGGEATDIDEFTLHYYKPPLERARDLGLPVSFLGSQWESGLSGKPSIDLPAAENPNVVTVDGGVLPKVSPFGPVGPWRDIGRRVTHTPWMKRIQEWYPAPPRVFFISNNEHGKLTWAEAETERRYVERFGKGRDDDFKRAAVADGWIERYRALRQASRFWRTHRRSSTFRFCLLSRICG